MHEGRTDLRARLRAVLERTLQNGGATIVPAFSLGRKQELLYEINGIFADLARGTGMASRIRDIDVIVYSPLASRFTHVYEDCEGFWDEEAKALVRSGDQPLVFDNLMTVEDHKQHQWTVDYLQQKAPPYVVIVGSGMCTGGQLSAGTARRQPNRCRIRRLSGPGHARASPAIGEEAGHDRW